MKTLRTLLTLSLAAGCAAPPETIATDQQAITEAHDDTIDQSRLFHLLVDDLGMNQFKLELRTTWMPPDAAHPAAIYPTGWPQRSIVFTPSASLSQLAYNDPDPTKHETAVVVPAMHWSPSWPKPDVSAWPTSIGLDFASLADGFNDNFAMTFGNGTLAADVKLTGRVHVSTTTPWPDADVDLVVRIHAALAVTGGHLGLSPYPGEFTLSVDKSVTNCGIFDWCDGLVSSMLPDLESALLPTVRSAVTKAFADFDAFDPVHHDFLVTFLETIANLGNTGVPFYVPPSSVALGFYALDFRYMRVLAPAVAPTCSVQVLCGDKVSIGCNDTGDPIAIYRQDSTYSRADWDTNPVKSFSGGTYDYPSADWAVYRLCSQNVKGKDCAADVFVTLPHTLCSSGGGSSTKTGCTRTSTGALLCKTTG